MAQDKKKRRFCLCIVLYIVFFGICLTNAKTSSFLHMIPEQEENVLVTDKGADLLLQKTSYVNVLDANLNMEMQQQTDEYSGDCDEDKYWVGMPQESFVMIKKKHYMDAQMTALRNEHQREQATCYIHESDGKKRDL